MKVAKRIFLFICVNLLIVTTITIVTQSLGIQPYLQKNGINYQSLALFCLIWGFGAAFISLALSRVMAKWMMGVKLIAPDDNDPIKRQIVAKVHDYALKSGLANMPQVGIYDSPEINAFATGPTKSRSLVAVSTGLLEKLDQPAVDGVLAHEVAHIANGDMVTMTLIQGVVNAFVMFLARVVGFFVSQFVDEERRQIVQFVVVLVSEILIGLLGSLVVSAFSRAREFRADHGGATLAGSANMISALQALKANFDSDGAQQQEDQPAIASLKISGKSNGFLKYFSTHPSLDDRINKLKLDFHHG